MENTLYKFTPITEVDLSKLEDERWYHVVNIIDNENEVNNAAKGLVIKVQPNWYRGVLLPIKQERVSDEEIVNKADEMEAGTSWCSGYSFSEGAKWMRDLSTPKEEVKEVKSDAAEFAEWINENFWIRDPFPNRHTDLYMWTKYEGETTYESLSVNQLYQLFIKETSK